MNVVGPTRLILIRAGKYDYGEVELVRPLHLVGPNNVGKTSLIAALQFLYIDDQRQMHFARDIAESRRYYFPDVNSYVLFECMTPTGFQVFGVHGLGPLKQYDIQRFAYQGRFEAADFLDEGRHIREGDEIKGRLVTRGYTLLEPRHLRAALTGIGEGRGVHLGLVPLRHRDHYERFRAMFRNLLRLAHLRQEELKEFLIEIHSGEFQQRAIDLNRDYTGQYEKVRRGAAELSDLRAIEAEARRLLGIAERRDVLRRELPALWKLLGEAYAREDAGAAEEAARRETRRQDLAERQARTEAERRQVQARMREVAEERGALGQRLADLAAQADEFEGFLPEFERERVHRLDARIEEIGVGLRGASADSPERLRARIDRNERALEGRRGLLTRLSRTLATRLVKVVDREGVDALFRLFNPDLLGLAVEAEGIEVRDERLLEGRIRAVLGRVSRGAYTDDAVRVALSALPAADLAEYTEPERIGERIAELERELERDRAGLEAAENAERLGRERDRLRRERDACARKLLRHDDYEEKLEQAGGWRARHGDLTRQEAELADRRETIDGLRDELSEELRQVARELQELDAARRRRRESIQRLTPPDPEWELVPVADLPQELDLLLPRYEEGSREERRSSSQTAEGLAHIQARTYGRFDRETEAESLEALAEELEALEEKARAVEELWKGLAAGLGNAFKALNRDLETLRSRVDELNRSLARVSVSNLARLRLIVREHPEWVRRIRTVAVDEEMPLFSDRHAVDTALGQLGDLLSHYPRVRLSDLFDLHFEVSTPDGACRTYPHLESIESNGTTITIKVLINLMLLRGLLGSNEISLPFYLDEVASLDHENLAGIVGKSQELGFVPVLASPEAMDAADNLYFLSERKGRVLLEPRSSLLRIHRDAREGQGGMERARVENPPAPEPSEAYGR